MVAYDSRGSLYIVHVNLSSQSLPLQQRGAHDPRANILSNHYVIEVSLFLSLTKQLPILPSNYGTIHSLIGRIPLESINMWKLHSNTTLNIVFSVTNST